MRTKTILSSPPRTWPHFLLIIVLTPCWEVAANGSDGKYLVHCHSTRPLRAKFRRKMHLRRCPRRGGLNASASTENTFSNLRSVKCAFAWIGWNEQSFCPSCKVSGPINCVTRTERYKLIWEARSSLSQFDLGVSRFCDFAKVFESYEWPMALCSE